MTLLVAFIFWTALTWGMTYIASRAEITEPIRVRAVALVPALALLLACRACTAFWASQAAAAVTMGIAAGLGSAFPWHAWLYLPPTAGIVAIGVIDLLAFTRGGSVE
jgi:hypothetical protein